MPSLLIPSRVSVHLSPTFIKLSGPRGTRIRKITGFNLRAVETPEGTRLFIVPFPSVSAISTTTPSQIITVAGTKTLAEESAILSQISHAREGVLHGYRQRLRLVGVGFRATLNLPDKKSPESDASIALKLGYSHEVSLPVSTRKEKGINIVASRLDGRSKGTLLQLDGIDSAHLNHVVSTIRDLRRPDPYKGKGIHRDGEKINLKKGKREA
jgi:large subunit ribosomal protein L6